MPYLKSISIRSTVARSIAYILNPNKTEDLLYTASLNCMTNATEAYLQMKPVYEHYSGKSFSEPISKVGKSAVKAIHYIQSFDPADKNINPELAHKIAKAFVLQAFGDNAQAVISTHLDRRHLHSHIIINSYSVDGIKYNANKKTLDKLKLLSDKVCLAYGIQPYDKSKGKDKSASRGEIEHKKRGTSWKQKIRLEIDRLVLNVSDLEDLLSELERLGYEVKRGKYISIRAEGQERFVRTKTLGDDYSEENLSARIKYKLTDSHKKSSSDDMPEMHRDYYRTVYEVSELAKSGQKVARKRNRYLPYTPENDFDVHKLSAHLTVLNRDNIQSIGDLDGRISDLKISVSETRNALNNLMSQQETYKQIIEHGDTYFSLVDKPNPTEVEKLKLNICKQTIDKFGVNNADDLNRIKVLSHNAESQITELTERFKSVDNLYAVYSDIAATYRTISSGDYISRLVEEERKRREVERGKNKSR